MAHHGRKIDRLGERDRLLKNAANEIRFPDEFVGGVLVRIRRDDGERTLYVFLPGYDKAKIPAFEGALKRAGYADEGATHPQITLPAAIGFAVNDGLVRSLPEDFDITKINDLNVVELDIANRELKSTFSRRGAARE